MKTFEEEFKRSPTEEDFKIQAHTLETLLGVWLNTLNLDSKLGQEIKKVIKELKND